MVHLSLAVSSSYVISAQSVILRWAGRVELTGERRGVHSVLVGKTEGNRTLWRSSRKWEDNINMDLQEVEYGVVDWTELAQDRDRLRALVNAVKNLQDP